MFSLFFPGLLESRAPQGLRDDHETCEEKAGKGRTAGILRSWILISSPEILGSPSFSATP